jgi:uncharacterized membrane protein YjjP (DUF1212 family)/uncharacterized membrane protein YjjB (DUF3815 family)
MVRHPAMSADALADLALALAVELQAAGAPAHEVEAGVRRVGSLRGGADIQVLATPTSVQVGLGGGGHGRPVFRIARVLPGSVHLARREAVETVIADLVAGRVSFAGAPAALAAARATPDPWGRRASALATVLLGATASVFFGGTLEHAAVGGLAAGALWAFERLLRARGLGRLQTLLGSALVTVVTLLAARGVGMPNAWPALLGGVIALAPGYTLTLASTELAAQELVSGTSRLVSAGLTFLQLLLGIAGAASALGAWTSGELAPMPPPGAAALLLASLGTGLAFTVALQAHARDAGLVLAAVLFSTAVEGVGNAVGAGLWGPFVAATVLAAVSVPFSARTRHAEALLLVPGVLALVPGGMGLGSFALLYHADVDAGVATLLGTGLAAVALGSGLLLGGVLGAALAPRPVCAPARGPHRSLEGREERAARTTSG